MSNLDAPTRFCYNNQEIGSGRTIWGAAPKKQGKLPGMRREFIIRNRVRKAFFCEDIRGEMLFLYPLLRRAIPE